MAFASLIYRIGLGASDSLIFRIELRASESLIYRIELVAFCPQCPDLLHRILQLITPVPVKFLEAAQLFLILFALFLELLQLFLDRGEKRLGSGVS